MYVSLCFMSLFSPLLGALLFCLALFYAPNAQTSRGNGSLELNLAT